MKRAVVFGCMLAVLLIAAPASAFIEKDPVSIEPANLEKTYDTELKEITFTDTIAKEPAAKIRVLDTRTGPAEFQETFEIYTATDYTSSAITDFKTTSVKYEGDYGIEYIEWERWSPEEYYYTVCDVWEQPEKLNDFPTCVKSHQELGTHHTWQPFDPLQPFTFTAGQTERFRVIWHKKAELGETSIQTIPTFFGISCQELTWFNSSWEKRQLVTATDPAAVQGKLTVTYDDDMDANFTDLRFVLASDDTTEIAFWVESFTASTTATVWIEDASANVYMYYGNPEAVSASDGESTFVFFDDFEDDSLDGDLWTRWLVGGSTVESGGKVRVTGGVAAWEALGSKIQWTHPYAVRLLIQVSAESNGWNIGVDERSDGGGGTNWAVITFDTVSKLYKSREAGVDQTSARTTTLTTQTIVEVRQLDADDVFFYEGDVLKSTHSTRVPDCDLGIVAYSIVNQYVDCFWALKRELVATEPTFSFGDEEEEPAPEPITGLGETSTSQTTITWEWTDPTDPNLDYIKVYLDDEFQENVDGGTQEWTAEDLECGTEYEIECIAVDDYGHESEEATDTASTSACPTPTPTPTPIQTVDCTNCTAWNLSCVGCAIEAKTPNMGQFWINIVGDSLQVYVMLFGLIGIGFILMRFMK